MLCTLFDNFSKCLGWIFVVWEICNERKSFHTLHSLCCTFSSYEIFICFIVMWCNVAMALCHISTRNKTLIQTRYGYNENGFLHMSVLSPLSIHPVSWRTNVFTADEKGFSPVMLGLWEQMTCCFFKDETLSNSKSHFFIRWPETSF